MASTKSLIITFILLFQVAKVYCQGELVVIDPSVNPGMIVDEFKTKDITKIADEYFFDDSWKNGNIYLKSGEVIKNYPIKYDIFNHQVELMVNDKIKICPLHLTSRFFIFDMDLKDSLLFENADNFDFTDDAPFVGFFELILKDTYSLYTYHRIIKRQPNYTGALDMGDKKEKLVQVDSYYIIKDRRVLCELTSNVKKLDPLLFPDAYDSNKKIKAKSETQKISFVKYLNNL